MGSRRNRAAEEQARLAAMQAAEQAAIAREQLNFAREQWAADQVRQRELDAIIKRVTDADLERAAELQGWARDDRARYNAQFRPIEDELASYARNYDAVGEGERQAGQVSADIGAEYGAQRQAIIDDVLSRGSQLSAAQMGELARLSRLDQATATAGAQNAARLGARDRGYAVKMDAVSMGRGLPSQALAAYGGSAASGASAVGNSSAGIQSFRQGGAQFIDSLGAAGQMFGNAGAAHMGAASAMRQAQGPTRWAQMFGGFNDVINTARNFINVRRR